MEEYNRKFDEWIEQMKKVQPKPIKVFKEPNQTPMGTIFDSAMAKLDYMMDVLRFGLKNK